MNALRFSSIHSRAGLVAAFFIAGLGSLIVPAFTSPAFCQKAEPRPLTFSMIKRGVYMSKVSKQTVKGDEEAEYFLVARKTQRFSISINAAPSGSVYPQLHGLQGSPPVELRQTDKKTWAVTFPRDSPYVLTISRTQKVAGLSRYAFTATVR